MRNTLRTFIAISLPQNMKNVIQQAQNALKKLDCDIKWVHPENVHVTLKFLGEIEEKKMDLVKQTLALSLEETRRMTLECTTLGAFPSITRPQILWVGLNDRAQSLAHLAALLEKTLGKIGLKKSKKPFHPHMTIGRVRSRRNLNALSQALSGYAPLKGVLLTQQNVVLYKSTLMPQGPIYEVLYQKELH